MTLNNQKLDTSGGKGVKNDQKRFDIIYERSTQGKLDSQADALCDLVLAHWKKGPKFGSKIDPLHNWYQTEYTRVQKVYWLARMGQNFDQAKCDNSF